MFLVGLPGVAPGFTLSEAHERGRGEPILCVHGPAVCPTAGEEVGVTGRRFYVLGCHWRPGELHPRPRFLGPLYHDLPWSQVFWVLFFPPSPPCAGCGGWAQRAEANV